MISWGYSHPVYFPNTIVLFFFYYSILIRSRLQATSNEIYNRKPPRLVVITSEKQIINRCHNSFPTSWIEVPYCHFHHHLLSWYIFLGSEQLIEETTPVPDLGYSVCPTLIGHRLIKTATQTDCDRRREVTPSPYYVTLWKWSAVCSILVVMVICGGQLRFGLPGLQSEFQGISISTVKSLLVMFLQLSKLLLYSNVI